MEVEARPRELIKRLRYLERLSVKGADRMRPRLSQSAPGTLDREESQDHIETRQINGHSSVGHLGAGEEVRRPYSVAE